MNWSILDCSLRDGGYYTNWDFEQTLVQNYIQVIADLPIKYVEVGYRQPTKPDYAGEYYYLPRYTLEKICAYAPNRLRLAVILDAKNCSSNDASILLGDCQDLVQLVRIAVSPDNIDRGIALAKAVKDCGFEVAINLMYLSKIVTDYSVLFKFEQLGDFVDYLYLVDSFGACFPNQVRDLVQLAKDRLPQKIGFHGHENLSLALANSLAALDAGADIVDSTVLGMGRGAGNLRTELIVAYFAQAFGKQIDLSPLADLLETFQGMKEYYCWGTALPYIVSGLADLPQKDVMEWIGKKRYSTSAIVQALQGKQQTVLNSEPYPQLSHCLEQLNLQGAKTCVIVGGGLTAAQHSLAIAEYVKNQQAVLIHSSLKNR